jgi:hypothetical protein
MNKILIVISILLCGCATTKPVEIVTTPIERTPLNLPDPVPIELHDIEWIIITQDNYQEVFDTLVNRNINRVIFGLTDEGYKSLSLNFAEIKKYIDDSNLIIAAYKDYYENK